MNAVNLIPGDARKRQLSVSASPVTLGLIGVLLAVLVAAVLYVSAANDVTARKSELARVTASVTSWQASANSYLSLVQSAQARTQQLSSVRQLADGRFPWSQLLSQVAGLMPAKAALSSLQATPATDSSASGTSTSTTASTTSTTPAPPTVSLAGCAASQSTVAQTMVALHKISGVSAVTLATAADSTGGGSPSSGAAPGQSGACPFPVSFQVSLTFSTPAASAPTAASGSAASGSTPASAASGSTPASAASGSTPASGSTSAPATPAATSASSTTGASQ